MQALAAHQKRPGKGRRRWPWIVGVVVAVLVAGAGGYAFAVTRHGGGNRQGSLASCRTGGSCASTTTTVKPRSLAMATSKPAPGATKVPSNTTVQLQFSQPLQPDGPTPSITPPVAGAWHRDGKSLVFSPSAPFVPYQKYTVTVPGGTGGLVDTTGQGLPASKTVSFTVDAGNVLRLQQLLAMLNYLPLGYTEPAGVAPEDMAQPQSGTLTWRWPNTPTSLMDVWSAGQLSVVTKGAVMAFETQNGLSVDGVAGPQVWSTLLADVASGKVDSAPYTYVLVTKTLPQHLTAWVNGVPRFTNILVNTGVNGATTADGTYPVFEHVKASTMIGTNVTGSHYDDPTVPWASYFNGGDALHGFPRAHYGYPQSNGCVEMNIATAGNLWPYTPIGTLVTVIG